MFLQLPDVGNFVLFPVPRTDEGEVGISVAGTHEMGQHAVLVVGLFGDEGNPRLEQVHVGMCRHQGVKPDRTHRGGGEREDVGSLCRFFLHSRYPSRNVIEFAVEPEEPLEPHATERVAGQLAP